MMQSTTRILWQLTPATTLSLVIILCALSFGWLLPSAYGQENGPVENLQLVVLGLATLVAFSALFTASLPPKRRNLYALSGVFLLLAIARELSWGRALYMDSAGNIPPLKALWYGSAVYPVVTAIVAIALLYFISQRLHKELLHWFKCGSIPLFDLLLIILGMAGADIIEHHSFGLLGDKVDLLEELWELAGYTGVLSFMVNIVFNKSFHDQP